MTLVAPEGVPSLGARKVKAIVTMPAPAAPKLATEINAASSEDVTLYLSADGWSPTGTTAKGTAPRRLGSKRSQERLNTTTYSLGTLRYVYDPQGDDDDPGNEAKALFTEGSKIHLLERLGLDAEEVAFAVGQKTRDHYVELGPQIPMGDPTDENAEFVMAQECVYVLPTGPVDGIVVT
jgi:hypothetical protein